MLGFLELLKCQQAASSHRNTVSCVYKNTAWLNVFQFTPPEMHSENFSASFVLQLIFTISSYILELNGSLHICKINYPQVVSVKGQTQKQESTE